MRGRCEKTETIREWIELCIIACRLPIVHISMLQQVKKSGSDNCKRALTTSETVHLEI